jgi:multidrug efflux pump subunit AcrB
VFIVMAVQYNSIIDPFSDHVHSTPALAGGLFGLYVTQTAIGATVLVGAVLLVGIVVNIGIIMIELANQIREQEASIGIQPSCKALPNACDRL